jgi:membrane-associated phospholipid phosphatase
MFLSAHGRYSSSLPVPELIIVLLFGVTFPILFFLFLRKTGKVSDQDTLLREERALPFFAGIIIMLAGYWVFFLLNGRAELSRIWLLFAVSNAALFIISKYEKISAHLLILCASSAFILSTYHYPVWPFLMVTVLVAISRYILKCHTWKELLEGAVTGGILGAVLAFLFR